MNEPSILVADDDEAIRQAVRLHLQKEGYAVLCAADGLQALELLAQKPVQLILMDVMMPNVDGLTTARIIRALDRPDVETVPILALTANAFAEDARKCLDADMNAHLAKPLNMPLVKATIAKFTQH